MCVFFLSPVGGREETLLKHAAGVACGARQLAHLSGHAEAMSAPTSEKWLKIMLRMSRDGDRRGRKARVGIRKCAPCRKPENDKLEKYETWRMAAMASAIHDGAAQTSFLWLEAGVKEANEVAVAGQKALMIRDEGWHDGYDRRSAFFRLLHGDVH